MHTHARTQVVLRVFWFNQCSLKQSQPFENLKWFSFGSHVSSHLRVVVRSLFSTVYRKHARLLLKTTSDGESEVKIEWKEKHCLSKFLQLSKYIKQNKTCMQVYQGQAPKLTTLTKSGAVWKLWQRRVARRLNLFHKLVFKEWFDTRADVAKVSFTSRCRNTFRWNLVENNDNTNLRTK